MSSSYRIALDKWIGELDIKVNTVYDVGGSQEKVKDRVKSWEVSNYVIFDLPEPHVGSPKPDVEIDLNSGQNIQANGYLGLADVVFCLEVFEYIYRPEIALKTLKRLMNKDGVLWASFPSQYPMHNPIEDDSLRYMPGGIVKLANLVGLNVEEVIYRRFETDLFSQMFSAERMRAAKNNDHNFSGMIVRFSK